MTVQRLPASQGVADRFTRSTLRQHGQRLDAEPDLEVFQYRHSAALALGVTLLIGESFDLSFDAEQRFEELDSLVRPARRFQQLRRLDELTPSVHSEFGSDRPGALGVIVLQRQTGVIGKHMTRVEHFADHSPVQFLEQLTSHSAGARCIPYRRGVA
jgi:hypothetical protein